MRICFILFLLFFLFGTFAQAAVQEASLPARQAGITPAWEVRPVVEEAGRQLYALSAVLDQMGLDRWPASEQPALRELLATVRPQIEALRQNFLDLADKPDRLSLLLEALARLDSIVHALAGLRPTIARYQDTGLAIDLERLLAAALSRQEKLFAYAGELARFQEEQLRSATQDVARCQQNEREREQQSRPPNSVRRRR